jgi:hypothetical protein
MSNGYFDEEVHRAVDDLNRQPYFSKLTLINRGQLLKWATELGVSLWPSEMRNVREVLEIFLHDGHDLLPLSGLASILEEMLALRLSDRPLRLAELERAVPSAALFIGIVTHQFSKEDNHFAIASAWCLFLVSAIACYQRAGCSLKGKSKESIILAEQAIKYALVSLWDEMQTKQHFIEGNAIAEPEVYKWRYTLICGLLSSLWLFPENGKDDTEYKQRKRDITKWLSTRHEHLYLWGEAVIPCLLALHWFLQSTDTSEKTGLELVDLFQSVVAANRRGHKSALPDPYYSYEDVTRFICRLNSTERSAALGRENFAGSSYSADLLLHLMARNKLKEECQHCWPDFNRLFHKHFLPAEAWQYCLLKCEEGAEMTRQYPAEYSWTKLQEEANCETCDYLPDELAVKPHILLLWLIIAPHRLTTAIGLVLDAKFRL